MSLKHPGGGTQRKPSQRSGGGQSAFVVQRKIGVQLPATQSSPTLHSASPMQPSRGMHRRSSTLQSSSAAQSASLRQPVATQRASLQRKPTPQSRSTTQSPVNTQRAPVHEKPTEHSASPRHSPVNTQTSLTQVKPGAEHGVVSEPVAAAMAAGVRATFGADVGVSITGVAGPGPAGGVDQGTVCIGVEGPGGARTTTIRLPGDRERVRRYGATATLHQVLRALGEWPA